MNVLDMLTTVIPMQFVPTPKVISGASVKVDSWETEQAVYVSNELAKMQESFHSITFFANGLDTTLSLVDRC